MKNTMGGLNQVAEYSQKEIVTYEKEFPYEDLLKLKQQAEINIRLEIKDMEEIVADAPEEERAVPQMAAAVR